MTNLERLMTGMTPQQQEEFLDLLGRATRKAVALVEAYNAAVETTIGQAERYANGATT